MKQKNMSGGLLKSATNILVGVPLMGASAGQVGSLPSGTAKTISGAAVGVSSVSLLGESLKPFKFKQGY